MGYRRKRYCTAMVTAGLVLRRSGLHSQGNRHGVARRDAGRYRGLYLVEADHAGREAGELHRRIHTADGHRHRGYRCCAAR